MYTLFPHIDGIMVFPGQSGSCIVFPAYTTPLLSKVFRYHLLYKTQKAFPFSKWSEKLRGWFSTMNVDNLLFIECGRAGMTLKKSLVRHQKANRGIFYARPIGQGIEAGYFYSSLEYADVCH